MGLFSMLNEHIRWNELKTLHVMIDNKGSFDIINTNKYNIISYVTDEIRHRINDANEFERFDAL